MSILQEIKNQVLGTGTLKKLIFTKKCREKMNALFLSEAHVRDVFFHGETIKENIIVKKCNGYEIGLYYFQDKKTADYIITSVWKRNK